MCTDTAVMLCEQLITQFLWLHTDVIIDHVTFYWSETYVTWVERQQKRQCDYFHEHTGEQTFISYTIDAQRLI